MFTGIIQGKGEVVALEKRGRELRLRLRPLFAWEKPQIGESVAVNGACLTMETWSNNGPLFTVYASAETTSHTALDDLRVGIDVNLERALALGDRLGGHLVSGHVDIVARIESIASASDSRCVRLGFDEAWSAQIIPRGSVTLDGASLTVTNCGLGYLEVNIIPATWSSTTISDWKIGRRINLETDVIGKYVGHLLAPYVTGLTDRVTSPEAKGLTMEFLREHGF